MEARVTKWGNSLGIRMPSVIADKMQIKEGTTVELELRNEELIVRRKKYELEELLQGVTEENRHNETDWGAPSGKEAW